MEKTRKVESAKNAELTPKPVQEQDRVSARESIELRITDLSSPAMVAGLARRC
ncbi:hypothetical protein AB0I06_28060 [Streptomyces sp. NPDC050674]|uniref:hypothetical protein n=1 Tax=Streptomyces TaxID=1883 RepID=UPI00332710FB